jgi:nitrous oxide reductase accessory protein NosL
MSRILLILAFLGVTFAAPGCERRVLSGPPELRLGRTECAECGMLVSEERCSSAMLIEREGVREHAVFDDIGCMLSFQPGAAAGVGVIGVFVHDHATGLWAPSGSAVFLIGAPDPPTTPMGSGIIAFADRAGAQRAQEEYGGELTDYAGLVRWREAQTHDEKEGRGVGP